MQRQQRSVLVAGLGLEIAPRVEPSKYVLTEGDPSACRIYPVSLSHERPLLCEPAYGVGFALEALVPLPADGRRMMALML